MPKRKRDRSAGRPPVAEPAAGPPPSDGGAARPAVDPEAADALALFAERHRRQRDEERRARAEQRRVRRREDELAELQGRKDDAATRLKAVRRQERIAPGEVEQAEADYTAAVAALVTFETGTRPTWAPHLEPESAEVGSGPEGSGPEPGGEPGPETQPAS